MSNLDLLVFGSLTFTAALFLVGTALVFCAADRKRRLMDEAEAMDEIAAMFNETQRILDERAKQEEGKPNS